MLGPSELLFVSSTTHVVKNIHMRNIPQQPSRRPTAQPSKQPSKQPTCQPTRQPTRYEESRVVTYLFSASFRQTRHHSFIRTGSCTTSTPDNRRHSLLGGLQGSRVTSRQWIPHDSRASNLLRDLQVSMLQKMCVTSCECALFC